MTQVLRDHRILVVEDESLVAMLLETILEDMGCVPVGAASSVAEAHDLLAAEGKIDGALLDVNVGGTEVFPVADALIERGIPFVFSTGYGEGGLPERFRGHTTIQKPFTEAAVCQALMSAMGMAKA